MYCNNFCSTLIYLNYYLKKKEALLLSILGFLNKEELLLGEQTKSNILAIALITIHFYFCFASA